MTVNLIDKCDVCGGELKPGFTTLELWRGETLVEVCREAGNDVLEDVFRKLKDQII